MILCQKCGQNNDITSNFCRYCGHGFGAAQPFAATAPATTDFGSAPPRPYSWKTDEFNLEATRPLSSQQRQIGQMSTQPDMNLQPYQPQQVVTGYYCPQCHSRLMPRHERRISTGGWIVFGVMMLAFFPLFWIGLLIREDVSVCPVCNHKFKSQ